MYTNFVNKLDDFLCNYYNIYKNAGILRITSRDGILYEKYMGFANNDSKFKFNDKSIFTFYSLSKPFCAIGLLLLKDKQLVDIDVHPSKYVPEAQGFDSRVTIRQMLHHISGLPDFFLTAKFHEKYTLGLKKQIREHLKELTEYQNVFEPGAKEMYANINYNICALIIENVSGLEYDVYMRKMVFEPLGMLSAYVDDENLVINNRVSGHELADDKIIVVDRELNWMLGAGDIIGTVDDVYCLNKAIKHKLLLKKETWNEVLTGLPITTKGMGCTIDDWHGKKRITHNGGHRGFRTLHMQLPEDDFDIIFLSNSGWGNARYEIAEAVLESYYGVLSKKNTKIDMDVGYI